MLTQLSRNRFVIGTLYSGIVLGIFLLPRPYSSYLLYVSVILVAATAVSAMNFRREFVFTLLKTRVNRRRLAQVVTVLSIVMVLIGTTFFTIGGQPSASVGLEWSIAGGFLLAVALTLNSRTIRRDGAYPVPTQRRTRWIPTLAGVVLLAMLAEISGNFFDPSFLTQTTTHLQFVLWIVAPLLLAYGVAGRRLTPPGRQEAENNVGKSLRPSATRTSVSTQYTASLRKRTIEWLPVVLIVLLALIVRVWRLQSGAMFFIDEIHFSNPVLHFYASDQVELLLPFSSVAAFPYLYPYMQWLNVEAFGRNLVGLRMVSVLFGVMNVYALYLLARELFDRKTALLAAALLAVFPPHIHFSRIGLNNIADPAFGTLALYFIARGLKPARSKRLNFAWAGAMLGLTQYFYEGGRLLFPALVVWWLMGLAVLAYTGISGRTILAWWQTRTGRDTNAFTSALHHLETIPYRQYLGAAVVMMLVAALVAVPVYYTLVGQEREVMTRLDTAGLRENTRATMTEPDGFTQHFINRFYESFLIHTTIAEAGYYYRGETGLLLAVMIPFFMLGAAYALWRLALFTDMAGTLLVLLWIALTWLGNTLMQESRISARYVVEFPALCLLVALGMRAVVAGLFNSTWQVESGSTDAIPQFKQTMSHPLTPNPSPSDYGGEGLTSRQRDSLLKAWLLPSPEFGGSTGDGGKSKRDERYDTRTRHASPLPASNKLMNRVLVMTLGAMMVVNVWYYFEPHLTTFREQFRDAMHRDAHDVFFRSADFPTDTHIYFISSTPYSERDSRDMLAFLNPDVTLYTKSSLEVDDIYMQALIANRSRAFFVEPDDQRIINLLHQYVDNLEGPFYSPQDMPITSQYVLYWSAQQDE